MLACEADAEVRPFIISWSRAQHAAALTDADQAHLLIESAGTAVGFVLLAGLESPHRGVELRRIVTASRGRGHGRAALTLVLDHAFGVLGAHRVWLDVKVGNTRARGLYTALGFTEEGLLRDAVRVADGYESLVLMALPEHEWPQPPRGER